MGANDPRGVVNLDRRGLVGRNYVGDYETLLHTKYISCWPHGFREKDFVFHLIYPWELMTTGSWPVWTPGAWLAGFM